ncbi:MAG TPA: beta-N-acetylhexosaminidase [Fimbriimonas sp.]|nr:beta-N-acetylhexosaminidase [Fimbriimonas sp.]
MLSFAAAALIMPAANGPISIIPRPAILIPQPGTFRLSSETKIDASAGLAGVVALANEYWQTSRGTGGTNVIRLRLNSKLASNNEGYRMEVEPTGVTIVGKTAAGVFYGLQNLRQLSLTSNEIPSMIIEDQPQFSWRGAHLDVGRHFMPKEFVKKYIDVMALHKLNTFHWHLTEDQGWRIEIKKYPKLTEIGSIRSKTMLRYSPAEYEEKEYGGFYTQEDVKEIVAYAKQRFVNVVPEIEMPGHAQAAIAAYPELGNSGKPVPVGTLWGVNPIVFNPEEKTIKFLQDVLTEVMALFPSKFIHIGGDECPKDEWKASPRVQQLMKERGLKDEHEMQSWFVKQMDQFLAAKGRRLIGWDEILEGGLAPGATVMSWRGEAGGITAAKAGHDVVMASTSALYLDFYQSRAPGEPHAIGGYTPLQKVYQYNIVPKELTPAESKHILGGQFQIWTEYIRTPAYAEYMAYPRACAASEIFWSPSRVRKWPDFVGRLTPHMERLKKLGVNARPLDDNLLTPALGWKAGDVSNDYQVKRWNVSSQMRESGDYTIRFQYTSGGHRLDVEGIEIFVNGASVAKDSHFGRTGIEHVDNAWKVSLPTNVAAGTLVELVAKVRGDGGGDSNGEITITKN